MKQLQNSRAASPAPPSQQQTPIAAAFVPARWQQAPFSAHCNFAPTRPTMPQTSPHYVVLRTPAVAIVQFLIDGQIIRNPRKCLKTIVSIHF